jgi:hypothetical protein
MKKIINALTALCLITLVGCAGGVNPAIGTWDLALTTPLGALPAVLVMNENGTGSVASEALGSAQISDIVYDGNQISFPLDLNIQEDVTLSLQVSASVTGDTLEGEAVSDFGPFAITGNRQ